MVLQLPSFIAQNNGDRPFVDFPAKLRLPTWDGSRCLYLYNYITSSLIFLGRWNCIIMMKLYYNICIVLYFIIPPYMGWWKKHGSFENHPFSNKAFGDRWIFQLFLLRWSLVFPLWAACMVKSHGKNRGFLDQGSKSLVHIFTRWG